jgi:hypothetical protein
MYNNEIHNNNKTYNGIYNSSNEIDNEIYNKIQNLKEFKGFIEKSIEYYINMKKTYVENEISIIRKKIDEREQNKKDLEEQLEKLQEPMNLFTRLENEYSKKNQEEFELSKIIKKNEDIIFFINNLEEIKNKFKDINNSKNKINIRIMFKVLNPIINLEKEKKEEEIIEYIKKNLEKLREEYNEKKISLEDKQYANYIIDKFYKSISDKNDKTYFIGDIKNLSNEMREKEVDIYYEIKNKKIKNEDVNKKINNLINNSTNFENLKNKLNLLYENKLNNYMSSIRIKYSLGDVSIKNKTISSVTYFDTSLDLHTLFPNLSDEKNLQIIDSEYLLNKEFSRFHNLSKQQVVMGEDFEKFIKNMFEISVSIKEELEDKKRELEKKIDDTNSEIESLNNSISGKEDIKNNYYSIKEKINNLEKEIEDLKQSVEKLNNYANNNEKPEQIKSDWKNIISSVRNNEHSNINKINFDLVDGFIDDFIKKFDKNYENLEEFEVVFKELRRILNNKEFSDAINKLLNEAKKNNINIKELYIKDPINPRN